MFAARRVSRLRPEVAALLMVPFLASPAGAAGQAWIAGTAPSVRPADAPVLTAVEHDKAWLKKALAGVSKPVPPSLDFLKDQGDWYTPFMHPGMPGRYDLRTLHRTSP